MKNVVRISRAQFDPQTTDQVIALLQEMRASIWPKQQQLAGYVDGYVAIDRQNGAMLWVTFWDSVAHGNALGLLPEMKASNARFTAGGLKFDPITTYEIL